MTSFRLNDLPSLEIRMLLSKSIEITHQLVDRFFHMHMPDFCPYGIFFRQDCCFLFRRSESRFRFVSAGSGTYSTLVSR